MKKLILKHYSIICILLGFLIINPAGPAFGEIDLKLSPNTFDKFSVDDQLHTFFRHDSNPSLGKFHFTYSMDGQDRELIRQFALKKQIGKVRRNRKLEISLVE